MQREYSSDLPNEVPHVAIVIHNLYLKWVSALHPMSQNPDLTSNAIYYSLGAVFILLGIAFFLVPLMARSGSVSGFKIPWIILYVYNSNGFYFATSPILIIISIVTVMAGILR